MHNYTGAFARVDLGIFTFECLKMMLLVCLLLQGATVSDTVLVARKRAASSSVAPPQPNDIQLACSLRI